MTYFSHADPASLKSTEGSNIDTRTPYNIWGRTPIPLKSTDGRSLTATVTGMENGEVIITKQDGKVYRLPLSTLDEASKITVAAEMAKTAAKPENGAIQNKQQEQQKKPRNHQFKNTQRRT